MFLLLHGLVNATRFLTYLYTKDAHVVLIVTVEL